MRIRNSSRDAPYKNDEGSNQLDVNQEPKTQDIVDLESVNLNERTETGIELKEDVKNTISLAEDQKNVSVLEDKTVQDKTIVEQNHHQELDGKK